MFLKMLESMGHQTMHTLFENYFVVGPQQSSISTVLNKNGKMGWCNLHKALKSRNLKTYAEFDRNWSAIVGRRLQNNVPLPVQKLCP